MKTEDLLKISAITAVSPVESKEINGIYCCDILGNALGKLRSGNAWITVSSGINSLAVAFQKDASCLIIADNIPIDNELIHTASDFKINLFSSKMPVFETAYLIGKAMDLIRQKRRIH